MTCPATSQFLAAREAYVFVFAGETLVLSSLLLIFYGKTGFLYFIYYFLIDTPAFLLPRSLPAHRGWAGSERAFILRVKGWGDSIFQ